MVDFVYLYLDQSMIEAAKATAEKALQLARETDYNAPQNLDRGLMCTNCHCM